MNIKQTIRDIRRLMENKAATEGEVLAGAKRVKHLMDLHHLSEDDLEEDPEDQYNKVRRATMKRQTAYAGNARCSNWEASLATLCGNYVREVGVYCDCAEPVRTADGNVKLGANGEPIARFAFKFYGIAEDVILASELFYELRLTVATLGKRKYGGVQRGIGRSYCEGFVRGLRDQLNQRTNNGKADGNGKRRSTPLGTDRAP